ncbi:CocE/NonD family hydrolase [Mycolicibacterium brumae]|uniref:Xaa-Pro dipeptidyl-peptidase C-terminal domain-containing protein n=1 Tax=Mycolicibacterium brumae TaxID=85968 RepID=A0A2G5PF47_9MYCO|nr:CocE/NonD family hydrolase [Mycolicibacterium brumae]MCV7191616.1 CocE/NonD family hydrolase [Mycolicibacterium brumae]PIB76916.1 hypothetical protein CQY22_004585 [Mycolicibacterium brumae]RWA20530.1 hypothetical protein MBRU_02410 [Mycolicibacterium brumae DSM 44177]UWW07626.1 CocE/NonD family hydrolase [Mycolicibacterium brumae]
MHPETTRPAADRPDPGARFDIGPEIYPKTHLDSTVVIPMSDGIMLCADLFRPADDAGAPVAEPLPTVVQFTAYNRVVHRTVGRLAPMLARVADWVAPSDRSRFQRRDLLHGPASGIADVWSQNRALLARGYAVVVVDVRGAGTSTGEWDFFSPREQQDYREALEWIGAQPWCDGRLGTTGISYAGIAGLLAGAQRPKGLDAVFASMAGEDAPRELGLTGGVITPLMGVWLAAVNFAKWAPSPRTLFVNGLWPKYLTDRISHPASWLGRAIKILGVDGHPDGYLNDQWAQRTPELENIRCATLIHAGWHDVYNRSTFAMYDRIPTPPGRKQVVVDEGYHLSAGAGFGEPGGPPRLDELQCAWFDRWLRDIDNGVDGYGPITLRRQGNGWLTQPQFPDPAAEVRRLYLHAAPSGSAGHAALDASLREDPPTERSVLGLPAARSSFASNNTAIITTGLSVLFGPDFFADERRAEAGAVTFSTEPFDHDVVISGPMNLRLRAVAGGADAFWSVTVSDVEPTGTSVALTRGALLSSRRAVNEKASTYVDGQLLFPIHSLRAEDAHPLTPGQPFDIDIEINPTDAVLRCGHRLRVAVAAGSFPRHYLPRWLKNRVRGQSVLIDPANPGHLTFLSVP